MGCPFWNQNPCRDVSVERLYLKETPYLVVKKMTIIEYDLKEILIRLENKIDKIGEDVSDLKVIEVLAEKVEGITERLDTQEFINRGVIIGLILAVLGGFAKVFGLTN